MNILQIAALGIISTVIVILLKESKPELSMLLGVGTGILILVLLLDGLFDIIYTFYDLAALTGLDKGIFASILKIIGVGYITEFSSNICADAGNKSVGDKISFAGKIIIMLLALPIITGLVNVIAQILP